MTGLIPQSNALSEAGELSLNEAMNMDPERYREEHSGFAKVITALRAQRERFAASESAKTASPKTTKKTSSVEEISKTTLASPDDLGF